MGLEPDQIVWLLGVGLAIALAGLLVLARGFADLFVEVRRLRSVVVHLEAQDRGARDTLARYERAWRRVLDAASQRKPHPADSDQPTPWRESPVA
jgi:hypothetical protein